MKPVCIPCRRFFRPKKNGYAFVEGMPKGGRSAPPGTECPEGWKPYKLWVGDLWECQGCGADIVVGVSSGPIREHFHPDFAIACKGYDATVQINDC